MLPVFAAIVCKITVYKGIHNGIPGIVVNKYNEKGTKVKSATSFVINILEIKLIKISAILKERVDLHFEHKKLPNVLNIPRLFKP